MAMGLSWLTTSHGLGREVNPGAAFVAALEVHAPLSLFRRPRERVQEVALGVRKVKWDAISLPNTKAGSLRCSNAEGVEQVEDIAACLRIVPNQIDSLVSARIRRRLVRLAKSHFQELIAHHPSCLNSLA